MASDPLLPGPLWLVGCGNMGSAMLDRHPILISILAGVELSSLRARFAAPETIVKAMPNLPVRLGKGVVGLFGDSRDLTTRTLVTGLMASLGHAIWYEDEQQFALAGVLTGAGP